MNIAISNLAWNGHEEPQIAKVITEHQVTGVEIAPTKLWPDLRAADEESIRAYRQWWEDRGIGVVALQSLLFGRPDLNLFADAATRLEMLGYLSHAIRIAALLGARVLVFGSPKNRQAGSLDRTVATDVAVDFFSSLGAIAHTHGVCVGLEPNPEAYGCDFVHTSQEALDLVKRVASPGIGVHLDTAILSMTNERFEDAVDECFEHLVHVHVSEPMLGAVGDGPINHQEMARALRASGYENWVSIEMRSGDTDNAKPVNRALDFVKKTYAVAA